VLSSQPGQPRGDRDLGRVDCPERRQLVGRRRPAKEEALTVVAVELDQPRRL
jgi:hypothetical protein